MKECHVFDPLVSKRQQLLLAAQLVRAVLKIDDVVRIAQMRNTITHTPAPLQIEQHALDAEM